MNILLVEDNRILADLLKKTLKSNGHKITSCSSVKEILKNGLEYSHDLIILDLLLDGENGECLVKDLRGRKMDIPILIISCLFEINRKVDLLKLGADDYLTKPFDSNELLARIEALGRRCVNISFNDDETYGDITFYWKENKIIRDNKVIYLTRKQGGLLHLLVQNKGKTVMVDEILRKIWDVESGCHSNIVQSMVRRLRRQVDEDFSHKLIRNIHGIGYCVLFPPHKEK